jgi:NTP pyrophosphatase (non-canonical NTP hydrolase)
MIMRMDLRTVLEQLRRFVADREWSQFHDPKNLSMLLASEAGELLAEYRWIANTGSDAFSSEPEARGRIEAEIGDVGLSLLLLCDRMGLDLVGAMHKKLLHNEKKYPVALSKGRATRPVT